MASTKLGKGLGGTTIKVGPPAASGPPTRFLQIIGEGILSTHSLPAAGEVVIGRAETADVRIDDRSISRRHARLHLDGALRIEDLGSANGTFVRGRALARGESATLSPGEIVDIGGVLAVVQTGVLHRRFRRVWGHGYFEGRLEDECAWAQRSGARFAVLRIHLERDLAAEVLWDVLPETEMVASYGPGEYELLLRDAGAEEGEREARRIVKEVAARGAGARTGLAFFPSDGRSPDALIARACERVRGRAESHEGTRVVVLEDEAMLRLARLVERIAQGNLSILLLGETGVGKEVIAEMIHQRSPRAGQPLVRLNCAAISETLLESELFGHEKGAFTGAVQSKAGLLETAHGGTFFLDEIGELPLGLQSKLLRVLDQREVLRVGALKPRIVDVRFIAATNRDLEAAAAGGGFRQDLYFRLKGASLVIPPLRERACEIVPMARAFVAHACRQLGRRQEPALSKEAIRDLQEYSWPGNIRELRNAMERAVLLCEGEVIAPEHLPLEKMSATVQADRAVAGAPRAQTLQAELASVERQRILDVLASCAGNQSQAARRLGISRPTLLARLERYGVPRPRKNRPE